MEAKLAEYRAKKKAKVEAEEKRGRLWRLLTLQFLFGQTEKPPEAKENEEDREVPGDEEQPPEPVPWTNIDYVILIVKLAMWTVAQVIFVKVGFGAVFFATSAFAFIWLNLGNERRRPGRMSAYSVFNPGFENIQGTFTAQQFEQELRHRR